MKKIYRYGLAILILAACLVLHSPQSVAQSEARKIGADELKKLTDIDRTFWDYKHLDRLYFSTNGTMLHQINEPWKNIPPGTILNAKWSIEGDTFCWQYDADDAQRQQVSANKICFDVYSNEKPDIFMTNNHPNIRMKPVGSGPKGSTIFTFHDWNVDSYILDPDFVPGALEAMQLMEDYRYMFGGHIPNGTINRSEMNPVMQDYYDMMINNIFFINRDYMFFVDTGDYYWIQGEQIDAANGDIEKMIASAAKGSWSIKDNIHCWRVNDKMRSCEYVFPRGKGLYNREFEPFLGLHYSGMTRLHKDSVEHIGHIPPEKSETPELFKKLAEISRNKAQ